MKEVTEWNGKPRLMWVWDGFESHRIKEYVVYILTNKEKQKLNADYPVITFVNNYRHCAEIEEEKKRPCRPCTREELIEMFKKQGVPMLLRKDNDTVYTFVYLQSKTLTAISSLSQKDIHYTYEELCTDFTLLDGTELWMEENV